MKIITKYIILYSIKNTTNFTSLFLLKCLLIRPSIKNLSKFSTNYYAKITQPEYWSKVAYN